MTVKNDALLPTGSFKDRGAAVLVKWLIDRGATRIVLDSSGNAGAAIAAYASCAGMECDVYVPAYTSPLKVAQVQAYGARIVLSEGPRAASTAAAQRAADSQNAVYASHQWHPAFVRGIETLAFELWEQCTVLPTTIVMPVGAGTLLLGVARGFQRLRSAGLVAGIPRLIGVQASGCAPIAEHFGFSGGPATSVRSIAEGIQVDHPPRAEQIVTALKESAGVALVVADDEIATQMRKLGRQGLLVEPTAAAAFAGLELARTRGFVTAEEFVVVVITGSGLKTLG